MNLAEVAKHARVSTATVSRVVNGVGNVSRSTHARVMRAVAELNYYPNLHARTLAGGRNPTIGVILSNLENPFFFDIFRKIESEALQAGYEVTVANTGYDPGRLVSSVRMMIGRRVAGLAVIVSEMDPVLIRKLTDSAIPAVFYDVGTPADNITNLRVNYKKGIQSAVRYLYSLGHRRMAFVEHHATLDPISDRHKTFSEVLGGYTPPVQFESVGQSDSLEGGQQAARHLLSSGFRPTAIVCVNDLMAVGVLHELRERGLRVPQDVSVTGFDNIRLSEFCSPPLTTVHIPRERIGAVVFECLVGTRTRGIDIVIEPEFIVRESTGPPGERQ